MFVSGNSGAGPLRELKRSANRRARSHPREKERLLPDWLRCCSAGRKEKKKETSAVRNVNRYRRARDVTFTCLKKQRME